MSKLEKYLSRELYSRFGHLTIKQNYRPDWLQGLELDFYVDEMKIAAEVQGEQHYSFIKYFHKTIDKFELQKKRDSDKSILCKKYGVELVEIFTETDADIFVQRIGLYKEINPKSKNIPSIPLEDEWETNDNIKRYVRLARKALKVYDYERAMKWSKKAIKMGEKLGVVIPKDIISVEAPYLVTDCPAETETD